MKKLFLILFSLCVVLNSFATVHPVGSGSGSISVTSMSGLSQGDTLGITAGTYSGGMTFSNLTLITILPLSGNHNVHDVFLTTNGIGFGPNKGVEMGYLTGIGGSGAFIDMKNTQSNIYLHNFFVSNWAGNFTDGSGNKNYTFGDTSTLKWYKVRMDSINLFKCGGLNQGSFGSMGDSPPKDVMDSLVVTRVVVDSTTTNGTQMAGIYFRFYPSYWRVTYNGTITVSGDVGLFQMNGSGIFHDIYLSGGRGYMLRLWNLTLSTASPGAANAFTTKVYNCGKSNTVVYGGFDIRNDSTQWTPGQCFGANLEGYYNTGYNLQDNISFWSPLFNIGDWYTTGGAFNYTCILKYNAGANFLLRGRPPITTHQGVGTLTDTTGNYYGNFAINIQIDTTGLYPTLKPTAAGPLANTGAFISYAALDFYLVSRSSAGGTPNYAGFAQPQPNIGPCNCIPKNGFGDIYKNVMLFFMKPKDYIIEGKNITYES